MKRNNIKSLGGSGGGGGGSALSSGIDTDPLPESESYGDHRQERLSTTGNRRINRNNTKALSSRLSRSRSASSKSTCNKMKAIFWTLMLAGIICLYFGNKYFSKPTIGNPHLDRNHLHAPQTAAKSKSRNKDEVLLMLKLKNSTTTTDEDEEIESAHHLESSTASLSTPFPHVVFIGDSLLRYAYLEWLHHQHYHSPAPKSLINEKRLDSWYSFFQSSTAHFQGYMTCDCRRSYEWSLGKEVENRYYFRGNGGGYKGLAATYIQAYGENQAHGRFLASEIRNATVSPANDTTGYKWGYMGCDWDNLVKEYVAKLEITPTLMVFNAGFWPNDKMSRNLGSILRSAKDVMGDHGRVVWKGITPVRGEQSVHPSSSDLAAKEWSYRYPWLSYEVFDTSSSINEEDYFDDKHFSNPSIYREWNQGITLSHAVVHRVFILVGGVRTLSQTQDSILKNLIYPICAPPTCIAHLVTHFSRADNRPGSKGEDPGGKVLAADSNDGASEFFDPLNNDMFPDGFLIVHAVDGYEIGSAEEQRAMDLMESEIEDPEVVHRLRVIRYGDPRRYSMWFARAYAFKHFERLSIDVDFVVFCRPDMLWLMPAPTKSFFDDISLNKTRDIWVNALYYSDASDTFAFLPSLAAAKLYFSLHNLVRREVACLGGPALNQSVVEQVLTRRDITVDPDLWCKDDAEGWSEKILRKKLLTAGANVRYVHASAVILRPPSVPECQCSAPAYMSGWARIPNSHVPMMSCLMLDRLIKQGHNANSLIQKRPLRIRGSEREGQSNMCLSWNETSNSLLPSSCEFPYPPMQLFFSFDDEWYGYIGTETKRYEIMPLNTTQVDSFLTQDEWITENVELYSLTSHEEKPW